jgi:AraC-like DNA-binding protein
MIRWLNPPKLSAVAKYIECYWYLNKANKVDVIERPKLNPDPCAHLILLLPEQTYHYESKSTVTTRIFQGKGSHWLNPFLKTIELEHGRSFSCIGIKFKVGALYSLNQLRFEQELLDTVYEINNEDTARISSISAATLLVNADESPDDCCTMLDTLLQPWLAQCLEDKHSELTRHVLPMLVDKPINTLGKLLSCSQRTVERSFLKVTGLTLKQYQSMIKLEAILAYLYQRPSSEIDWADIAYQFGFSDQPHLIRYLKQQINLTPERYAQQRGFAIDVYGGVESK